MKQSLWHDSRSQNGINSGDLCHLETMRGAEFVCLGTVHLDLELLEANKKRKIFAQPHLIKCRDEEDSGLVRGTLLMLIRRLEGYLSSGSGRKKTQRAKGEASGGTKD